MARIEGVLVVDKPAGPTSHDVVAKVRRRLRVKTGHLGTLDPAATGVLPLVLGKATRLARFMQSANKEYLATIRLGRTTNTYDAQGLTVRECRVPGLSSEEINRLLSEFLGEVQQVPPMFSAVKIDGERLYKAARRGETRERPSRSVTIYELQLLGRDSESLELRVHCSSGTYIRSLAHDLGERLGCGAHLERLRRTRSGEYDLSHSLRLEQVEQDWSEALIPMNQLLPHLPALDVDERVALGILHGNPYRRPEAVGADYCRLFHRQSLLAIGRVNGPFIQPAVVLRSEPITKID